MQKSERIVRYTAAEIDERLARGEDQTNWAYVDALTEEELEASIDWEEEGEFDWSRVSTELPVPVRQPSSIHVERAIVAWFRPRSSSFRQHMSSVLREYVDAHVVMSPNSPSPHRQQTGRSKTDGALTALPGDSDGRTRG